MASNIPESELKFGAAIQAADIVGKKATVFFNPWTQEPDIHVNRTMQVCLIWTRGVWYNFRRLEATLRCDL